MKFAASRHLRAAAMVLAVVAACPALPAENSTLQPYQMVRSLQLVQDRIASGDHAALPMQNKLLEMIDARFRAADGNELADKRNFRAMLVYAMSGGNPATIEVALARLDLEEADAAIAKGILAYLRGRQGDARSALSDTDPMTAPPELGAFLALVKASIATAEDARTAIGLFDQARLLGPGTLIEEAALRRSVDLGATLDDAPRFLRASSQYVRRYLQSPYASQFADAFIAGVLALHASIDLKAIDDVVAGMDAEQRKFIYLRLARRSAIDGLADLSAFASERAERGEVTGNGGPDPRAVLYSSLASVTSETVGDVLAKLRGIDRNRLTENDRLLLDAAEAVAAEMTTMPASSDPATEPLPIAQDGNDVAESDMPAEAASLNDPRAVDPSATEPASPMELEAVPAAEAPPESGTVPDAADMMVSETRKTLEAIDKLLGETAR